MPLCDKSHRFHSQDSDAELAPPGADGTTYSPGSDQLLLDAHLHVLQRLAMPVDHCRCWDRLLSVWLASDTCF